MFKYEEITEINEMGEKIQSELESKGILSPFFRMRSSFPLTEPFIWIPRGEIYLKLRPPVLFGQRLFVYFEKSYDNVVVVSEKLKNDRSPRSFKEVFWLQKIKSIIDAMEK